MSDVIRQIQYLLYQQKKSLNTLQQLNQVIIIMGFYIDDNKLMLITEPKTISFNLTKKLITA